MKYDVITIGSASRDVFLNSPEFKTMGSGEFTTGQAMVLPLGSKIEVKKIVFATGGSGTNTAVTLARQGFKTACIGIIGNDLNASAVLEELAGEGVDTSFFQKHSDDITAYSVILVQDGGERTILSYKGEGQHFEASQISFDQLEADWLVLGSLGGHYELFEKAISWATAHGVKVACNPGTKELELGLEKLKPLLKQCAIVTMNQEEASKLLGIEFNKEDEILRAMGEVVSGIFVMTKGHSGVAVWDGQNVYTAGVPDSPIVERTGAGDAFVSGFTAEYARQTDNRQPTTDNAEAITKAIQIATANSSSVVTQYGSKAGILKKGDTGPWPLVEVLKK
jgi:ribokinase